MATYSDVSVNTASGAANNVNVTTTIYTVPALRRAVDIFITVKETLGASGGSINIVDGATIIPLEIIPSSGQVYININSMNAGQSLQIVPSASIHSYTFSAVEYTKV